MNLQLNKFCEYLYSKKRKYVFKLLYREAMTPSSLAEAAIEDVRVGLCGSVAN